MEKKTNLKTREEVAQEDKWNVESLFETIEDFQKLFDQYKDLKQAKEISEKWKGKLNKATPKDICVLHDKYYEVERSVSKLYVYSLLRKDEDQANEVHQKNYKAMIQLYQDLGTLTAWIDPELVSLPEKQIQEIQNSEEMKKYAVVFERTIRMKPHTRSKEVEEVMSQATQILMSSKQIFSQISDVNFVFGKVKDSEGKEHEITHGSFYTMIKSKDRKLRENAFKQYHAKYAKYQQTFTEILNSVVQGHVFTSKVRKYKDCLESAMFSKSLTRQVYLNLIEATHGGLDALHYYGDVRKKILGVDKLHLYDLYVPLIESGLKEKFTFDEGVDMCVKSSKVLGDKYQKILRKGLIEDRWVDRFENKGKRSGGYSCSHYDSFPFILMNFDGTLEDVFTLAHEGGHSCHSLLSNQNQPYHYADYPTFVAEVASIVNECNLLAYLLELPSTKENLARELYLLNKQIENIRTSFYRQVLFAEFELKVHDFVENKTPLTAKLLKDTYLALYKLYYGENIVYDKEIEVEWSRIPHFYHYRFYVYQYATGITAAIFLSEKMRSENQKEREEAKAKYIKFLSSGGSKFPLDLLKEAGVDMTAKETIENTTKLFLKLVKRFERLVTKLNEEKGKGKTKVELESEK